ncbi:succinate dehydrogenase flavoprotein subunit [Gluconacetobacter johannae DSM 13595]|uniref:L-aspartate oxidase n=1 Tax=Gluconacetobacter johannae TaxID=112140 RepID=A0A7W4P6F9_9PROT|nr:L-aspartate oxidase [Gluconacetobacter johannae]MBB2177208.1 L-aspartate oxidase [Gluconacetobacter johannae]GBQ82070.1 succinate dehydrogenase flavoprotein subunit [Gluconacetobacter johannae DSM 13595]
MTDLAALAGRPVIAGAGLAGLATALLMDRPCVVLSPAPLAADAASTLAQGGIAAAIGPDDTPELHARDTLAAGAGLCDPVAVEAITRAGPDAVAALAGLGVAFDRRPDGRPDLHLEAAHSRPRIAHANGDGTGAEIMRALVARVRATPRIAVLEGAALRRVVVADGRVAGVLATRAGQAVTIPTAACVIATGGVGALFPTTTSPAGGLGSGLACAARAGATLRDMEFVQFHPTALDPSALDSAAPHAGHAPRALVSEAVRGAGALLIDETGARFTDELAPRDVVARAIQAHLAAGHRVLLDARAATHGQFARHFPGIARACLAHGIDPDRDPIPVRPAAHYHMGGIETDLHGRTSVPGLWACGEAASTGLHGANRLASNSLLEAFVCGGFVACDLDGASLPLPGPVSAQDIAPPQAAHLADVRALVGRAAGILRDADGLRRAARALAPHVPHDDHALVGALLCLTALERHESRGGHYRTDYPDTAPVTVTSRITLARAWPTLAALAAPVARLPSGALIS